MPISIRCNACDKPIRIDDAFAGGVCRCPHCKQINDVPAETAGSTGARPAAPQARPDAPPPIAAAKAPGRERSQPRPPKRRQLAPIVAAAVAGLLLVAGAVAALVLLTGGDEGPGVSPDNPIAHADRANVLGAAVEAPVLYCVDAGGAMSDWVGVCELILRHSIGSLDGGRFNLLVWTDLGAEPAAEGWLAGDEAPAVLHLRDMPAAPATQGRRDLRALQEYPARTVVIFTSDAFADQEHPEALIEYEAAVVIVAIEAGEQDRRALAALAERAGGEMLAFDAARVDQWLAETPPLPPVTRPQ